MKILVTGATGLLGTDIVYALEKDGHEVLKGCFADRGTGYIAADIRTDDGIKKLDAESWDFVIHASASKNPDECEVDQEDAYRVNVWGAEQIALLAKKRNAGMLFVSSDYVFSGDNPSYLETSDKKPINYYGETKSLAEKKIHNVLQDVCILRVPILYGIRAGIKASDLLFSSLCKIKSNKVVELDNYIVRYPTYTGDVADVIKFLFEKNAKGVFHFSGQEKLTKFSILRIISDIIGKNSEHIKPYNEIPKSNAKRPVDCHLEMSRLNALRFKLPISFRERIIKIVNENKDLFL